MLSLSLLSIKDDYERIKIMDGLNPDFIHFDVADGKFVPPIADFLDLTHLNSMLDVHLMVSDIEEYVERYAKLNPEYITFHIEATRTPEKMISIIKDLGIKVGIAINHETGVDQIKPYLSDIDLVLVMSTKTGYGGVPIEVLRPILDSSAKKVEQLYDLREQHGYQYLIEIDGGITAETVNLFEKSDMFVVGSYITLADNYEQRANVFKNLV